MVRTLDSFREEVKEDETLKDEEDTSTETGESEENETESEEDTSTNEADGDSEGSDSEEKAEETVTLSKAEHEKLIQERDNYKQGLLAAKAKKRGETGLPAPTGKNSDINVEAVEIVLSKREEQKALKNTIDSKHSDYIPELVDEEQYNEIRGYLPYNLDKTSYDSIVRGLKLATKMWKEDKGIQDKSPKKDTGLQTTKSSVASSSSKKEEGNNRFKSNKSTYLDWYKK